MGNRENVLGSLFEEPTGLQPKQRQRPEVVSSDSIRSEAGIARGAAEERKEIPPMPLSIKGAALAWLRASPVGRWRTERNTVKETGLTTRQRIKRYDAAMPATKTGDSDGSKPGKTVGS